MSEQDKPAVNIEEVIGKYIDLRDACDRENNALKDRLAPMQAAMKTIEAYLMNVANATGQTKFGTERGTAFVTTKTGCNIADKESFKAFVQSDPGNWRLLTLSANKTAVAEYIEKGTGTPPPGLNWVVMKDIQIRRS